MRTDARLPVCILYREVAPRCWQVVAIGPAAALAALAEPGDAVRPAMSPPPASAPRPAAPQPAAGRSPARMTPRGAPTRKPSIGETNAVYADSGET